jgi:uncharacterized repeat protein (TIGR03803 family)
LRFDKTNGANPCGAVSISGDKLYGYANGGLYNYGVLFKMSTDGNGFTKIKDFTATNDGYNTIGAMVPYTGHFYGMTSDGGVYNSGVIYKVNPVGLNYNVLYNFTGTSGKNPAGSLVLSDGILYGMTNMGGSSGQGTIFRFSIDGSSFQKLKDLSESTGSFPPGTVCVSGSELYGMTSAGGSENRGVIFKINKDGSGYTKLFEFVGTGVLRPEGTIVKDGTMLYGMALNESTGLNLIFSIHTDGTGFNILHQSDGINAGQYGVSLILNGSYLYCATGQGGSHDAGTLFKIKTDGTDLQKLVDFSYVIGAYPQDPIVIVNSKIYGTTNIGGVGSGSIYEVKTDGTGFRNIVDFWSLFGHTGKKLSASKAMNTSASTKSDVTATTQGAITLSDNSIYISATETNDGVIDSRIFKYDFVITDVMDFILKEKIKIYPNPSKDYIILEFEGQTPERVEILNSGGIKVLDTKISSGQQINVSKLQSGIYTVRLQSHFVKLLKL